MYVEDKSNLCVVTNMKVKFVLEIQIINYFKMVQENPGKDEVFYLAWNTWIFQFNEMQNHWKQMFYIL
jgi:hypothetical protein